MQPEAKKQGITNSEDRKHEKKAAEKEVIATLERGLVQNKV